MDLRSSAVYLFTFFLILIVHSVIGNQSTLSSIKQGEATRKAANWVLNQRNGQLHWGRSTNPLALLALSHSPDWNPEALDSQLALKQLDIDFLHDRLQRGDIEIYSSRLIPLAVTLTSLCRNPSHFYDYDLLDGMLEQSDSDFTFASEVLTVCGGEGAFRRHHIRKLFRLLNQPKWNSSTVDIDTMAMIIMAAGCIADHYGHKDAILPTINQIAKSLVHRQMSDGSFDSNVVSTSLAIQALQVSGLTIDTTNATKTAGIEWLLSVQEDDGSFHSDLLSTTEAIVALSAKGGRSNIHIQNCLKEDGNNGLDSGNSEDQVIFQVLIWVGQPVVQKQSHFLSSSTGNDTLYKALEVARDKGLFQFQAIEYSFGHYIVSINNLTEKEYGQRHRWMVYVLPTGLNVADEPEKHLMMKTSISSHRPRVGERILFWYRPTNH